MPLCPRCGAAHHRDDAVCKECGKRLSARPQVTADQTSLSFPTCVDGPDGCAGPPVQRPDGPLRCSAHQQNLFTVQRLPDPVPLTCIDGPLECRGLVTPGGDGRARCGHHQELVDRPRWQAFLGRWFGLR